MRLDRLDVLLVERSLERGRRAEQRHHPLDQLLLEAGALGGLGAVDRALAAAGQQVLDVAEGEPAVADGARAAPRASGRARASARRPGPGPRRRVVQRSPLDRDHPRPRPALQRRRRDAGDPGRLVERDRVVGHRADPTDTPRGPCVIRTAPQKTATGSHRPRRLAGFTARFVGRAAPSAPRGPRRSRPSRRGAAERRGPLLACCRLDATETTPAAGADVNREFQVERRGPGSSASTTRR